MGTNILLNGAHSLRIIALPLARIKIVPDAKIEPSLLVFYHFDLASPYAGREGFPWHRKVLKSVTNKAADVWSRLGKASKGSWKLWTYELGERVADKIDFEELALRKVDPSLGPSTDQVSDLWEDRCPPHSLPKIPLIYPPSLYPVGAAHSLQPPLAHLQTLLESRAPQHRRGFYLWMFITPLTLPITLIPIVPNLPLFFCAWRSWSHYRAYRSSQYLSSLLNCGSIEPDASLKLDKLYASFSPSSTSSPPATLVSNFSGKTSTFGNVTVDGRSDATSGTGASLSGGIFPIHERISQILDMFHLPASTTIDMHRAMNQVRDRLGKLR